MGPVAVVSATVVTLLVTACGAGADGDDRPADERAEPSGIATSPTTDATPEVELLSPDTPPATAEELSERDLCVNASDYTYLVLASAQQAPTKGDFNDAEFARLAAERTLATAEALVAQLPPQQREDGQGAAATWGTYISLAAPVGYDPRDPAAFSAEFSKRVARYQEGNGRLIAYLGNRCDRDFPDYSGGLTPVR